MLDQFFGLKKLGHKNFTPIISQKINIQDRNVLSIKFFVPKIISPKIVANKKILTTIISAKNNFRPNMFCPSPNFLPKTYFCPHNFSFQIFFCQNNFQHKKIRHKKILPKILGTKNWGQTFFLHNFCWPIKFFTQRFAFHVFHMFCKWWHEC